MDWADKPKGNKTMKYLILYFLLIGCSHSYDDSLTEVTKEVVKKDRGVDIQVKPLEGQK